MGKQQAKSFSDAWTHWVQTVSEEKGDYASLCLERCLEAASTFTEIKQVFEATFPKGKMGNYYPELGEVRVKALKELINIAKNRQEAEVAFELASRKKQDGKYYFPARAREAEARLQEFSLSNRD